MLKTDEERSMKWKYFGLLAVSLAAYLVAGAFIFRATESAYEVEARLKLQHAYHSFLGESAGGASFTQISNLISWHIQVRCLKTAYVLISLTDQYLYYLYEMEK